jgi:hypothetical protein
MTAAFGTRPKRRLNRVLDAIGFEYPDYGRLGGDAGVPKRKRIASAVDEESTKVTKKKKEISEKLSPEKLSPEPKVAAARKRKKCISRTKNVGSRRRHSCNAFGCRSRRDYEGNN